MAKTITVDGVTLALGDRVWVDEGDSLGCYEFGGVIERINDDGTVAIRVDSQAIGIGVAKGSLRTVDAAIVDPLD